MKKYLIFTCILIMQIFTTQAQKVSGKIFERFEGNEVPLAGANVVQLNSQNGTASDSNGKFKFRLEPDYPQVLVVSYVSFRTDTIHLSQTGFNNIRVQLIERNDLQEVEISARQSGKFISRAETIGIVNINEGELEKAACCNLSESFENSAAVDVSYSDAVTGSKKIQMLGLAGIYTQFLTENIPNLRGLATAYGLGYVPGSWMESIQVSKGTSSVINGYEAMAGQINIEYKKSERGDKLFVNAYANQLGKFEANVNTRFQLNEKWSTAILAHAENMSFKHDKNGDDFLDQPLMSQVNLFNRWKYKGKQFRMQFGLKYLVENRQGGQMDFLSDMERTTENPYGIGVKTNRLEAFAKFGYLLKHRAQSSFGFQNQVVVHEQASFFGLNEYDAKQVSYYGNLMFQSYMVDARHQFTTGISFSLDNYFEDLNDSIFNRFEQVPGAFFQYNYSNKKNLNIIAGFRADYHNLFGWLLTPRLHAKYDINENNIIRLSGGKGYRSANVIAENTSLLATSKTLRFMEELKIESSWNFGFSYTTYIKISGRELSITADYFRTQFNNQIIIDREEDAFSVLVYNLDGKSFSNSFQIEANYEIWKNFDATLAFRYNDVKTTIGGNLTEKPMVSKFKSLLSLSYLTNSKTWQFDMNIQLNGDQRLPYTGFYPEEYQQPGYAPVYAIVNAQITRYFKNWDVYIGGENLGNYRQQDPIIAADDPFGDYFDSSIVWGPITGIKIFAGFRYRLPFKEETIIK